MVPREYRFIRRDGETRWLSCVGSPMYDVKGEMTGLLSMCTDTTERRLADERIQHLNAEVVARLGEVETLLSVAPIGIVFSYDAECLTIKLNPAAQRILGIAESSRTFTDGDDLPYRILQNGIEVPRWELPLQMAARSGIAVRDAEYEIVRKDEHVVQILCSASPLVDAHGAPRGSARPSWILPTERSPEFTSASK